MEARDVPLISGMQVFEIDRHVDDRGSFEELFSLGKDQFYHWSDCKQINHSRSSIGTVRGIHVAPYPKIVTCVRGKIYDVVVDMRPDSTTYGNWAGIWLSEHEAQQIAIPAGCGHAFYAAAPYTQVVYFQGGVYKPGVERNIHFKSPAFDIQWPGNGFYKLSEKDAAAEVLESLPQLDADPEPKATRRWWHLFRAGSKS